jgi:hypothetical protein
MGTTLALNGANSLAGCLLQHLSKETLDYTSALPPGIPQIIHPETAWGLWTLRWLSFAINQSGIGYVLAMLKGPPARAIKVEDYGFRQELAAKSA